MIGKPDSGKPTVRFDEGELEIEPNGHYASSLLYPITWQKQILMHELLILCNSFGNQLLR